jgi:ATP-dependent helicase/nuclease subunit A
MRLGLLNARKTNALHLFAAAFLPAYAAAKTARGWLDFDDLIATHAAASDRPGYRAMGPVPAGWRHRSHSCRRSPGHQPRAMGYRQSPGRGFRAGDGARAGVKRTIFVVGDKKQSIYSFQGADPEGFDRMRDHFDDRLRGYRPAPARGI